MHADKTQLFQPKSLFPVPALAGTALLTAVTSNSQVTTSLLTVPSNMWIGRKCIFVDLKRLVQSYVSVNQKISQID